MCVSFCKLYVHFAHLESKKFEVNRPAWPDQGGKKNIFRVEMD